MGNISPVAINEQWTPLFVHGGPIIGPLENSVSTPDIPKMVVVCPNGDTVKIPIFHSRLDPSSIVNLPGVISCIAVREDGVDFVSYTSAQFVRRSIPFLSTWQPDSKYFRSFDDRTTVGEYPTTGGFGESLDALREIVTSIRERFELRLSDDVEALLDTAVSAHGTPDDLEVWAQQLVEDVRDLTD